MTDPGSETVSSRLLSQKEYAAARGWSKQYVNQLVRGGRIQLIDGKIDPIAADEALRRHRDPARQADFRTDGMLADAPASSSDDPIASRVQGSFAKARTVREHYRAMREKLEFELAAGNLIEKKEVELQQFALARLTRDRILQSAENIASRIVAAFEIDERKVRELVDTSLLTIVNEIGCEIAQTLDEGRADADDDSEFGTDAGN